MTVPEEINKTDCPCPKKKCPCHADCAACRTKHAQSERRPQPWCERRKK